MQDLPLFIEGMTKINVKGTGPGANDPVPLAATPPLRRHTMSALTDSVGRNGANLKQDVMRVQRLLRTAGLDPGADDGFCNDQTAPQYANFRRGSSTNRTVW